MGSIARLGFHFPLTARPYLPHAHAHTRTHARMRISLNGSFIASSSLSYPICALITELIDPLLPFRAEKRLQAFHRLISAQSPLTIDLSIPRPTTHSHSFIFSHDRSMALAKIKPLRSPLPLLRYSQLSVLLKAASSVSGLVSVIYTSIHHSAFRSHTNRSRSLNIISFSGIITMQPLSAYGIRRTQHIPAQLYQSSIQYSHPLICALGA